MKDKDLLINMLSHYLDCPQDMALIMVKSLTELQSEKLKDIIQDRACIVGDMRMELARLRNEESHYSDIAWENEELKKAIIKQAIGVDLNDRPSNRMVL